VIYADPPWRLEPYLRETGMDCAADNHYPTMGLAAIKALEVPAAKDAVLFLWATVPRNANQHKSKTDAATRLNVGQTTVKQARVVQERADPVIACRVEADEVPVTVAARLATMPAEAQALVAAMPWPGGTDSC
jgi:hypothetical protein